MSNKKATDFQIYLKQQLKDSDFKEFYSTYGKQLEIAYKIITLRKKAKITQTELADKIGTTQSNIARMEKGQQNFTVNMLNKVAGVFGKELEISFD
ncbi:helix-turn-helix domain-containing protein [Candidatus Parcubacteria bacterium]|nr:helix-turn-helix domain-containing protein [Candidatus Parcubacteria bacterium]